MGTLEFVEIIRSMYTRYFPRWLGLPIKIINFKAIPRITEVDHAPELGASSPLAESLRALKTSIHGLYRLGVAIRQS